MNHALIITTKVLLAFSAMSVYEFLWSLYIHKVRDEEYTMAGVYNIFIMLSNGLTLILVVGNWWMLIPGAIGAFFGTWVSKFFYTKKPHVYKDTHQNQA